MTNITKLYNEDLIPEVAASGQIELLNFDAETLTSIDWLDKDGWPTSVFKKVINDIEAISPTEFGSGTDFFDKISEGFSVYNKFVEDGNNDE